MSNKRPFPMPQTLQSAGIEQQLKYGEREHQRHRGDLVGEMLPLGNPVDWETEHHIRCEYERQYGETQGTSTYSQGTVFVNRRAVQDQPEVKEAD